MKEFYLIYFYVLDFTVFFFYLLIIIRIKMPYILKETEESESSFDRIIPAKAVDQPCLRGPKVSRSTLITELPCSCVDIISCYS